MQDYGLPTPAAIAGNWRGTSWFEDQRAEHAVNGARSHLERFRAFLDRVAAEGGAIDVAEEFERFRARTVQLHRRAWAIQGSCVSWWIAGPAGFNQNRAEKRFRSRDKAYGEIEAHDQAARKAVERRAWPHGHPGGPIRGSNPDAPELLAAKIRKAERRQELMREANAVVRKGKTREERLAGLRLVLGFNESTCAKLLEPNYAGQIGFEPWQLSNNLANIKRMRDRLASIERKRDAGDKSSEHVTTEGTVTLQVDAGADRVQLLFPGKPSEATRTLLKRHAFRWSPRAGAWQRHLNANSIAVAEQVLRQLAPVEA